MLQASVLECQRVGSSGFWDGLVGVLGGKGCLGVTLGGLALAAGLVVLWSEYRLGWEGKRSGRAERQVLVVLVVAVGLVLAAARGAFAQGGGFGGQVWCLPPGSTVDSSGNIHLPANGGWRGPITINGDTVLLYDGPIPGPGSTQGTWWGVPVSIAGPGLGWNFGSVPGWTLENSVTVVIDVVGGSSAAPTQMPYGSPAPTYTPPGEPSPDPSGGTSSGGSSSGGGGGGSPTPSPSPSGGGGSSTSSSGGGDPSASPTGDPSGSPSPSGDPSGSPSPSGDPSGSPSPGPSGSPSPGPSGSPSPSPSAGGDGLDEGKVNAITSALAWVQSAVQAVLGAVGGVIGAIVGGFGYIIDFLIHFPVICVYVGVSTLMGLVHWMFGLVLGILPAPAPHQAIPLGPEAIWQGMSLVFPWPAVLIWFYMVGNAIVLWLVGGFFLRWLKVIK